MVRGLKIVIGGLVPILLLFTLAWVAEISDATARVLFPLGVLATCALFLAGTAMIATDKGHSLLVGLALGMIAPLGTMIALILNDRTRSECDRPIEASHGSVRAAATEDAEAGMFGAFRKMITGIAAIAAVVYALCHFAIYAAYMLRFSGGVAAAKVILAGTQGLMAGLAMWGTAVMLTVTFAPQQWLLNSSSGRQWMGRTGLENQSNTIPLRVMTAIIGTVAGAWLVLSVNVLITALTSDK